MNKFLVFLMMMVAFSSIVFAAEGSFYATTITLGDSFRGTNSTAQTVVAEGGNITEMNLSTTRQTAVWQAFLGSIENVVELSYGGNDLYNAWNGNNVAWIMLSNDSSVVWTSINGTSAVSAEDTFLGLSGADSVANTLTGTTHPAVETTGNDVTLNTAPTTTTLSNGGTAWTTALFAFDGSSAVAYGTPVDNAGNEAYNGTNVNYQMMVPTASATGLRTYSVYLLIEN